MKVRNEDGVFFKYNKLPILCYSCGYLGHTLQYHERNKSSKVDKKQDMLFNGWLHAFLKKKIFIECPNSSRNTIQDGKNKGEEEVISKIGDDKVATKAVVAADNKSMVPANSDNVKSDAIKGNQFHIPIESVTTILCEISVCNKIPSLNLAMNPLNFHRNNPKNDLALILFPIENLVNNPVHCSPKGLYP